MPRRYEMVLVADPSVPEPSHDEQITAIEGAIGELGGVVHKVDRWGRMRLAYQIKSCKEGNYTLMLYDAEPAVETEILRRIKLSDTFIRWLSIRADEEAVPTDEEREELASKRAEQLQKAAEREAEEAARAEAGDAAADESEADAAADDAPADDAAEAKPEAEAEAPAADEAGKAAPEAAPKEDA